MKDREKQILFQLFRNSKLSDRDIAKKLNISQSTVTRTRHKLENKIIQSYTVVPYLPKLGINLIAFTFANCPDPSPDFIASTKKFIEEDPNVVFAGHGEGLGKTGFFVSFHKDFSDYTNFMRKTRQECKGFGETVESFIVSSDKLLKTLNMSKAVEFLVNKE